jgi:DNA-binding NarL/FixJ family response regulator
MATHLATYDEIDVLYAVGSGEAFLERIGQPGPPPDIVLMDIELPGITGIETTERATARLPGLDVLIFTVFEDDERLFGAIRAGASGYLLKDTPVDRVVEALLELREGGAPISPPLARRLLGHVRTERTATSAPSPRDSATDFDLTEREREVLKLVVDGRTNREIADRLHLSPFTIKTHVKHIYAKLHVSSRAGATRKAVRNGLVR